MSTTHDTYHEPPLEHGRHRHEYQGQTLEHEHDHDGPHGYYEHPEDTAGSASSPYAIIQRKMHGEAPTEKEWEKVRRYLEGGQASPQARDLFALELAAYPMSDEDHGPGCDGTLNCTCEAPAVIPPNPRPRRPLEHTASRSGDRDRGADSMFGGNYGGHL